MDSRNKITEEMVGVREKYNMSMYIKQMISDIVF